MKPDTFSKFKDEKFTIAVEWAGQLPVSTTISSGTISAFDLQTKEDVSVTVLASTTLTIASTQSKATVQNGTEGKSYKLVFKITLSDASVLVEEVVMNINV